MGFHWNVYMGAIGTDCVLSWSQDQMRWHLSYTEEHMDTLPRRGRDQTSYGFGHQFYYSRFKNRVAIQKRERRSLIQGDWSCSCSTQCSSTTELRIYYNNTMALPVGRIDIDHWTFDMALHGWMQPTLALGKLFGWQLSLVETRPIGDEDG